MKKQTRLKKIKAHRYFSCQGVDGSECYFLQKTTFCTAYLRKRNIPHCGIEKIIYKWAGETYIHKEENDAH